MMKLSFFVLLAFVFGTAGVTVPQQLPNLKAGFTKLENEFYEAIKQKNVSRLDQMLAPDYVLVASARPEILWTGNPGST